MKRLANEIFPYFYPAREIPDWVKDVYKHFAPVETPPISEWSEKHLVLPKIESAKPGPLKLLKFQRLMPDIMLQDGVEDVILKMATQLGKTLTILDVIMYFIAVDPSNMLLGFPDDGKAHKFSNKRLNSMIDANPIIKERMITNSVGQKKFRGGFINIVGLKVPSNVASDPVRFVFIDEVDRVIQDVAGEGSPLELARRRTGSYRDTRRHIFASTPTVKYSSAIDLYYESSNQMEYNIPCPSCGHLFVLKFNLLKWEKISENNEEEFKNIHVPCPQCEHKIEESSKMRLIESPQARWIPKKPEIKRVMGFHMETMYSPTEDWASIIREYYKAQKRPEELMKTFINTYLAKAYQEKESTIDWKRIKERSQGYVQGQVPNRVHFIIMVVDVQKGYFEYEIQGYGENQESWLIKTDRIYRGDYLEKDLKRLETFFDKTYQSMNKKNTYKIRLMAIDSGFATVTLAKWWRNSPFKRLILLLKGQAKRDEIVSEEKESELVTQQSRMKYKYRMFGTNIVKDMVHTNLEKDPYNTNYGDHQNQDSFPEGYMHFPHDLEENYFRGLCAESKVKKEINGQFVFKWILSTFKRNEPFDLKTMGYAAVSSLKYFTAKKGYLPKINSQAMKARKRVSSNPNDRPNASRKGRSLRRNRGGIELSIDTNLPDFGDFNI